MTRVEVRICGLGGQGVVLAGHLLGRAAVYDGKKVVQTQSYGAEARGSAAKSEVIISDNSIGFPMIRNCDILVAMSQTALDKYVDDLKGNALLLVDKDLVQDTPKVKARVHRLPATHIAGTRLKSEMYANVVMLGALTQITKIVSQTSMRRAIEATVKADAVRENLQAFELGFSL
ncbi:MAG: 2-oxoacid:acceptor oxidoreductase family protein [Candidatus Bathyarchaeota archaeon]|nr:MAG: 2-oxoacid:acceptor oxidoreductase family protein [Candidatus Bathyarchaeota archaeon]